MGALEDNVAVNVIAILRAATKRATTTDSITAGDPCGPLWRGLTEREIASALESRFGQVVKVSQISEVLHGVLRPQVSPTGHPRNGPWRGLSPQERLIELGSAQAVYAHEKLWGLYTNAQGSIAVVLDWAGRLEEAWVAVMVAVYLSQNGPNNYGRDIDSLAMRATFPGCRHWEPDPKGWVTGLAWDIKWLAYRIGADLPTTKETFLDAANVRFRELSLPLAPEVVWGQIVKSKIWKEPVD